jgi:hypothetical protein
LVYINGQMVNKDAVGSHKDKFWVEGDHQEIGIPFDLNALSLLWIKFIVHFTDYYKLNLVKLDCTVKAA